MKPPLNPNAQKWVAALRSGEYSQGKSWLSSNGSFCCLGVACVVFQKEVGGLHEETRDTLTSFNGEDSCLPDMVQMWLGLRNEWGAMGVDKIEALYALNDNGTPFSEIADLIESQPEGLFA